MRVWLFPLVVATLAAGCHDVSSTGFGPPASIMAVAGATQHGSVGQSVPVAPTFVVKDAGGHALSGVEVSVSVIDGGGSIAQPATRTDGVTPVGEWTLGTTPGANHLMVSVAGLAALTYTATAAAGPPASLTVVSGNGQSVKAANATAPIVLRVLDGFGNPVAGDSVAFAVTAGGGSVASDRVVTAADGLVAVPTWTLGKFAVAQGLRATSGAVSADLSATVATNYNIVVRFYGQPLTTAQQAMFATAAARLSAIVTGDVPDIDGGGASVCGFSAIPPLAETVDDIVIYATALPIDGAGGTLAQSGPCILRPPEMRLLPVAGVIQLDAGDLASLAAAGTLQDVITHEILHVLGVGTLWQTQGMLTGVGTSAVAYNQPQAAQACRDSGGAVVCAITVPVENTGGAATLNTHWRESVFQSELMTGYPNSGGNPLSSITIGGLADLGYTVNRAASDLYAVPGTVASRSIVAVPSTPWERAIPGRIVLCIPIRR